MIENIIECNNLTKIYKKQRALDTLNLNIAKGEIFGLIGQNGAGKSTMMKLLAGLIHPSTGDFKLFGKDPADDPFVFRRIGTLIEQPGFYGNMSALQNMHVKALSMGCDNAQELSELLRICGLDEKNKKKVKSFSLGMKQRLGLALAMIGNPEILILDEPVNGLDPQGINDMRIALQKLNRERDVTIVLSSHILEELSKISTSYGIIKNGVLIKQMSSEELDNECKDYCHLIVDNAKRAAIVLEEVCHMKDFIVLSDDTLHILDDVDTSLVCESLIKNNVKVYEIMMHKQNLEAYYLKVSGGEAHVE